MTSLGKVAGSSDVVFVREPADYSSSLVMLKFEVVASNWINRGHRSLKVILVQIFYVQP